MVEKNEEKKRLRNDLEVKMSRLVSHMSVFAAYSFAGYFLRRLGSFIAGDSVPLMWTFRIVEYAFIAAGLLILSLFLITEVIRFFRAR